MHSLCKGILVTILLLVHHLPQAQPGQINIARVEQMPNEPQPYLMRDWAEVARGYDALVYDLEAEGDHLPLIFIYDTGINYPGNKSFGLDSYVGTFSENSGEAINVLPSLVGASLVGIDKSNQDGMNWVLYSQDYFNKNNGELIYLNGRNSSSGNDWWYDLMPNIYFYQLYDLYGSIGDAEYQFNTIADRFAEAVRGLGGSDTPWQRANMHYRAWDFVEMEPNAGGVHEPEAAGAFAWVLYHAYNQTGNPEYLKAAEWSMEFLSNLGSNPSYELQLPYGCYAAARMNAELGTKYPLDKMLFWVFNRGPLRGWGTIVDNWGGVDVSGLVGEANENGNDYAFQMNAVQQAAALVPMVRYDKHYARAIARWVLNMANATRFMFPGFLPPSQQDASSWSSEYDPGAVMGYEAMRETLNGLSPFATGDAFINGWAATNLALYGTSSIGYLGGMVSPTDIEKILLIDVLKTDFFHDASYPTYLLYNPYSTEKTVTLEAGNSEVDIYDALTESFLLESVKGSIQINIPADEARLLVYVPADGEQRFADNKMLIDDVVVDYWQQSEPYNFHPRIQSVAVLNAQVEFGDTIEIFSAAIDHETKDLEYLWTAQKGNILDSGKVVRYVAPSKETIDTIMLVVLDEALQRDSLDIALQVTSEVNIAPQIDKLITNKKHTKPGETIILECIAFDPNNDPLEFTWEAAEGHLTGTGHMVTWQAPDEEGIYTIQVEVNDDAGGSATASISILVKEFSLLPEAELIAYYPFSGNAMDMSGNEHHGVVSGAKLTQDFDGNSLSAYFFDGVNDKITVTNSPLLNFSDGITLSLNIQPTHLPSKESFILSHGSWQNRWKISITPERYLRWTVKTENGAVVDLDSEKLLEVDSNYHIAATYDKQHVLLYINGRLETFKAKSGLIQESPFDLTMGQMLPDDNGYNFQGVLDEVKIYDGGLTPSAIAELAGVASGIEFQGKEYKESDLVTLFPNPSNGTIYIQRLEQNQFDERKEIEVSVIDIRSNIILSRKLEFPFENLILNTQEKGIYLLLFKTNEHYQIERVILQ